MKVIGCDTRAEIISKNKLMFRVELDEEKLVLKNYTIHMYKDFFKN